MPALVSTITDLGGSIELAAPNSCFFVEALFRYDSRMRSY
jgi:hypothetical protein